MDLLLLLLLLLLQQEASSLALGAPRHPVPVLWVRPACSGPGPGNSSEVAPAVLQALQDLQRQPPPLGNYEIQLQELYMQCDPGEALKALFEALWAGPRYMLLLGGVCPSVTSVIARALPAFHLVQVSFGSPSWSLSNRKWYGSLFSTAPSDWALGRAAVKLLQDYRWTRVGLLPPPETSRDLRRQLLKENIQVVSPGGPAEDVCSSLRRLKEQDVRIIVAHTEEESAAAEVFCCAYRLDMFGARYQWILVGGALGGWRSGSQASGCTSDSLLTASDGSIGLRIGTRTVLEDSQDAAVRQLIQDQSELTRRRAFAYDAVWVAAKAASQVMEVVKRREKNHRQNNSSLGQEEVHRALLEALEHTHFEGLTGRLFYRNGERMATVELIQHQGPDAVLVGAFSTWTQKLNLRTQQLRFYGPGPARDRPLVLVQQLHITLRAYMVVSSAGALTIISTVTILFLTIINRKHGLLRAGGQDELLLLGLLLCSSSVLLSGLDAASPSSWTSELLCSVGLWTLWVGHTLTFAVVFTRTWVLYSASTPPHRAARVVFWAVLLDLGVLTAWQTLDPLRWLVLQHGSQADPADPDILIQLFSEQCSSANMELWLTAVFGYKGPLLVLGCYLAWNVRAGRRPAEGGKRLALAMFTLTAFSVSGAAVSLLTSHNPSLRFCLGSVLILCCHVFTLGFLLRLEPVQSAAAEEDADGEEEELKEWRSRAAQLDAEIQTLMMQLSEAAESAQQLHRIDGSEAPHRPQGAHQHLRCGDLRWVTRLHDAQIASAEGDSQKASSPETIDINAPEHMLRRLSVQLPILHHSYLPAVGGLSASSSSLFGSGEAFVHNHLTSCVSATTALESRSC